MKTGKKTTKKVENWDNDEQITRERAVFVTRGKAIIKTGKAAH